MVLIVAGRKRERKRRKNEKEGGKRQHGVGVGMKEGREEKF